MRELALSRPLQAGVLSDMGKLERRLLEYLRTNREELGRFVSDPISVLRSAAPGETELIDRIAAARVPAAALAPNIPDVELTWVEVTMDAPLPVERDSTGRSGT